MLDSGVSLPPNDPPVAPLLNVSLAAFQKILRFQRLHSVHIVDRSGLLQMESEFFISATENHQRIFNVCKTLILSLVRFIGWD